MNSASTATFLAEAVLKTANLLGLSNTQLAAVMGLDLMSIDYFMNAFNTATDGVPIQQIQIIKGLEKVLTVVEALNNH